MTEPKILIVEDNDPIANLIRKQLEVSGYRISAIVHSGAEAIEKVKKEPPDLVLMDILLEGDMDGIQAAEICNQYNIPVVYITAFEDKKLFYQAKATKPFGYLIKPFKTQELFTAVEVALAKYKEEQVLKENAEQYRQLIDLSPDAIILTDLNGVILMANKQMAQVSGCKRADDLISKNIFKMIIPEDLSRAKRNTKKLLETGFINDIEYRLFKTDNSTYPAEYNASVLRDKTGQPTTIIIVIKDITERKLAEEALRTAQEYAQNIIDSSLDMIIACDNKRKIIEFNKAAEESFGYTRDEVLGKHVDLLYSDRKHGETIHNKTIKNGRCVEEIQNRHKDGTLFPSILNASILVNSKGEKVGVMGISQDITELKKARAALMTSLEYSKIIIDSSMDMIIAVDSRRRITEFNKSAEEAFGYTRDEVLGKHINFIYADTKLGFDIHKTTLKDGKVIREINSKRKNGEIFPCFLSASVLQNEQGEQIGVMGVSRDITELKRTQDNLKRSEELYRLLSDQLAESNNLKEVLLDVITHDLKNPAGVISGMADLMLAEFPNNEMVQIIKESCDDLLRVVDNATTLSQLTIGEEIEKETINLGEVIHNVVKGFSSQLGNAGITLELKLEKNLLTKANPIIAEIFNNYISNAIKYAAAGEKIIIAGETVKGFLNIEVRDFGKTIRKEDRAHIFIRKYRIESSNKRGRGLGLAIVKRIAEAHNAEVGIIPNKPKGNNFYLKILKNIL